MKEALAIWVLLAMVGIAALRPRVGAILMWFAIWLYPNTLLYGLLPLDVRLDDLFVGSFLLVCLWRFGRRRGVIFGGTAVRLSLAWLAVQAAGNLSGLFLTGDEGLLGVVKSALKATYVPATAVILSCVLRSERDIDRQIRWMCVAGAVAALLGLATVYYPQQSSAFLIPDTQMGPGEVVERLEKTDVLWRRAAGSIGDAATANVALAVGLMALSYWLLRRARAQDRALYAASAALCLVALIHAQSRGAILGFAAAMLWGVALSRRRLVFGLLVVVGGLAVLCMSPLMEVASARFTGETGSTFAGGLDTRLSIWRFFIADFRPAFLLTGIGMNSSVTTYHSAAHSAYLGALVYGGVLGVAVLGATIVSAWRLSAALLARGGTSMHTAVGSYLRMLLIAMLVAGVTAENFQNTLCMQLLFAAMVLAEQATGRRTRMLSMPKHEGPAVPGLSTRPGPRRQGVSPTVGP